MNPLVILLAAALYIFGIGLLIGLLVGEKTGFMNGWMARVNYEKEKKR